MIGVIAIVKIKEGKNIAFEAIAKNLVSQVNSIENDNIFYRLYKKSENEYTFLEGYKNKEALDYHKTTDHYKVNGRAIAEFLDGKPEVTILEEVAPLV